MAKVSPSAQAVSRWLARVVAMIGGSTVTAVVSARSSELATTPVTP